MAKAIPDETALGSGEARPAGPGEKLPGEPFVPVGQGAIEVGQAMNDTSVEFQRAKEQHDALRVEDATNQLINQKLELTHGPDGFMNLKGAAAVNTPFLKTYADSYQKAATDIGTTLDSTEQRQAFARRAAVYGLQMQEDGVRHLAQQTDVYRNDVLETGVTTQIRAGAAQPFNPAAPVLPLVHIKGLIDTYAQQAGKDSAWAAEKYANATSAMYTEITKQALASNPLAAQDIYRAHYNEINPEHRAVLETEIRNGVRPIEAKRTAEFIVSNQDTAKLTGAMEVVGQPLINAMSQAESAGDNTAVSPKGAKGLMQLMPDTAREVATRMGLPYDEALLTADTDQGRAYNKTLGTQYMQDLMVRYNGNQALALAAYNAGPKNADKWVKQFGDPREGGLSGAEWAAKIPFKETRDYVLKLSGGGTGQPNSKVTTQASLGNWIAQAEQIADTQHPNDPVYKDLVVSQIKSYVGTIVAAQEGQQRADHVVLMQAAGQGADKGTQKPTTLDEMETVLPGAKAAFYRQDAGQQRGVIALLDHNLQASMGRPVKADSTVMDDLFQRIHAKSDDPRRIWSPAQLTPYYAHGMDAPGKEFLEKEIADMVTPEGARLAETSKAFFDAIKPQFDSSTMLNVDAKGKEDANKFWQYGKNKEREYRAAGKDPYTLYNPASPDYLGKQVAAFQRSLEEKITGMANDLARSSGAGATTITQGGVASGLPKYKAGQVYKFKQGDMTFLGGDEKDKKNWKAAP